MYYFIYAKDSSMKRFQPLDVAEGTVHTSVLYASMFDSKNEAMEIMERLSVQNPSISFKLVKKG